MFLVKIAYKKPIEMVEKYLQAHRDYLETGYQKDYFVVSGPQNPRVGGILLSQLKNRDMLETLVKQDPFYVNDIAHFEIIEFEPVKYHKNFATFI